jgi:hypothetical protein
MALGESFSPSAANQMDQANLRKRRTPVQQALQTVNLQAPVAQGSAAVSNRLLSGQGGAAPVAAQAGQPGGSSISAFVNALMGSGGSSTSGFAGGGFGSAGPVAGAGGATTRPSQRPSAQQPGTLPGVGAGGGPKPPGGGIKLPGLPGGANLPGNLPGKVQGAIKDIGAKLPTGGFQLPSGLKPPKKKPAMEAPEPGSPNWKPPINPNIPGMGLLEPPKPPVITPPAPPVNFGGGGPSFSTPTGGFTGAGTSTQQPTSGYQPAPPQQSVNPNGSRGGVYHNAQGVPYAFGPSGPPPGATNVVYY